MAGSLVKIDEEIVTSAVASVPLTGIDSTYDVYLLVMNNVSPATLNADVYLRVTESGTASSDSDYDLAYKLLRTDTTFTNIALTNQAQWGLSGSLENEAGKTFNGHCYIFNANNSSEYTFVSDLLNGRDFKKNIAIINYYISILKTSVKQLCKEIIIFCIKIKICIF